VTKLFVSDLHLDACRPAATGTFLRFLKGTAREARDLYVLGDLFESWTGDDDPNPLHQEVASAIAALSKSGTRCFFMAGNRDFVIGPDYLARCELTRLNDPTLICVAGQSVLVSHGDIYCTDDIGYQRYRRIVYNPLMRAAYDALPFAMRSRIVGSIRSNSQTSVDFKPPEIMDVNQNAIEEALRDFDVGILLHGHTHRPAIHEFTMNGHTAHRIVLGDWYKAGSVLRWDEMGPRLETLPF
jgi:UDP-2,3-diacylglucosamine hydrolase